MFETYKVHQCIVYRKQSEWLDYICHFFCRAIAIGLSGLRFMYFFKIGLSQFFAEILFGSTSDFGHQMSHIKIQISSRVYSESTCEIVRFKSEKQDWVWQIKKCLVKVCFKTYLISPGLGSADAWEKHDSHHGELSLGCVDLSESHPSSHVGLPVGNVEKKSPKVAVTQQPVRVKVA